MPADALQPAQHVRQVAAEHAAIRVQLVDDDEVEVLEQLRPSRMVREDARVHHVGIAEDDVRARANGAARILRRVAVVGVHADRFAADVADRLRELVQLRHLILRERLGRKQIQRARRRLLQDAIENRQVVAERLARCRRRGDDDLPPAGDVRERFGLVRVELRDAARFERGAQARIDLRRERRVGRFNRRQAPDRGDDLVRGVGPVERLA